MAKYEPYEGVAHALLDNKPVYTLRITEEPEGCFTVHSDDNPTILFIAENGEEARELADIYLDGVVKGLKIAHEKSS